VILEEVIASMQSEYGTPATPQEYRLLVRVGGRESHAEETQPAPSRERREPREPRTNRSQPGQGQAATARRRTRLRRRPRRPGAKPAADDTASTESGSPGPAE